MRPLSIFKYYNNNKKRFLSIFISVTLSVILIYIIQMVIFSSFHTGFNIAVEPKKYFATVSPKGEVLNDRIIREVTNVEGVDKVIPCVFDSTSIMLGIGSYYSTTIMSLEMNTIPDMMKRMGLKLIDGKMPYDTNDILLHKQVAANKHLKINDYIGRAASKKETLPGIYHIVGIIDGPSIVSFAPIEYYLNAYKLSYKYIYGGIILPKAGEFDKMNAALDAMDPINYQLDTYTVQKDFLDSYSSKVEILVTAINVFIILIVSTCIGFLCYIYFSQRRSEFGLLWALGFSRQQVINRMFAEVNVINLAGYVIGVIMSLIVGVIMNLIYFVPIGDSLQIINLRYFLGAACSPIFVTLFSLVPVWRMLKKLDPITIIDGTIL